jgi:hypothetical protein
MVGRIGSLTGAAPDWVRAKTRYRWRRMHIHLPKAAHTLREMLTEIAIIVIGILVALSLEQVIEHRNDERSAHQARASIRQEIADDIVRFDKREQTQACIDRRLEEIAGLLQTATQPGYRAPSWIGRPQWWEVEMNRWQAASQAGRVSLFKGQEQSAYSAIYEDLRSLNQSEDAEQLAWARLRALEDEPHPPLQLLSDLRFALQDARFQNWAIRTDLGQIRDIAATLSLPKPRDAFAAQAGSKSVCLPLDTPRDRAVVLSGSERFGEP